MTAVSNKKYMDTSEDSINKYLKDVRKIEMIDDKKEVELAKRIQEGDEKAAEELINPNLRFVISVAKDYQNQGLPLSDLISEGNLGLIEAAKRFDHTKGYKFISYAVWWIKQAIKKSLNDNSRTVRLPVNITNQMSKVRKEILAFEQEHHRKPTDNEVDMSAINQPTCNSLNQKINEDGDEVLDVVEDDKAEKPDQDIYTDDVLREELEKTMETLDDREKHIIMMYFGLDGRPMTLSEIGEEYELTKERIRQIKEKAVRKLKNNCGNLFEFMYK